MFSITRSLEFVDRFKVPEPLHWFVLGSLEPGQTRLVLVMVYASELFDPTAPIGRRGKSLRQRVLVFNRAGLANALRGLASPGRQLTTDGASG